MRSSNHTSGTVLSTGARLSSNHGPNARNRGSMDASRQTRPEMTAAPINSVASRSPVVTSAPKAARIAAAAAPIRTTRSAVMPVTLPNERTTGPAAQKPASMYHGHHPRPVPRSQLPEQCRHTGRQRCDGSRTPKRLGPFLCLRSGPPVHPASLWTIQRYASGQPMQRS